MATDTKGNPVSLNVREWSRQCMGGFATSDKRLESAGEPIWCDGDCDGCRFNGHAYRGPCGRTRGAGWEIALVGSVCRDSSLRARCNGEIIREELNRVDPDGAAHDDMRCGHWAVGWVDHLIVDPGNEAVMQVLIECIAALADYPVLSDDRLSAMECEAHDDGSCDEDCSFDHCSKCHDALQDHARGERCMSCD